MLSIPLGPFANDGVLPFHDIIPEGMPWWQAWHFDPYISIPIALAAFLYLRGLFRWERRSREHPWWRTACYLGGIALLLLALQSPLDPLGLHHFTFHMIQHELVMMIAIPLILLGAPTTPTLRGMPVWMRHHVVRPAMKQPLLRGLYRFLTFPIIGVASFVLVLWMWHLMPGWYERALQDELVHDLQHLSMAGAAVLFWWNVIDPKPLRSRIPHLARILYLFAAGVPKVFLAAILTYADDPFYAGYLGVRSILDLTPIEDQQLGGLIMWVPSKMLLIMVMGVLFFVAMQRNEREQREDDARRREAAARPPEAGSTPASTS